MSARLPQPEAVSRIKRFFSGKNSDTCFTSPAVGIFPLILLAGLVLCGCSHSGREQAPLQNDVRPLVSIIPPDSGKQKIKPPSYTGHRPYIAVCYTRRDSDRVYPLVQQIQDAGFRVWYDEGIPLGTNWEDEVANRLAGAEQVIFFLSEATMRSHWTRRELSFSLNKKKEILPLFLEKINMPDGWLFLLGPTQFISLHELTPEQQQSKLTQALSPKANTPAQPPHHRRP